MRDLRTAAAVVAAAAFALAGCGGTADSESDSGGGRDAVDMSAFSEGIAEQWRVPGDLRAITEDGTAFLNFDSETGSAAVYRIESEQGDPLWEGTCASATILGKRVVCDVEIIDVESGEVTPLPEGSVAVVGNDEAGEHLAVSTDEGGIVGYDAELNELWRTAGMVALPDPASAGRVLLAMSAESPEALDGLVALDLQTGEVLGEVGSTANVAELADGYAVSSGAGGIVSGYSWDGEEQWSMSVEDTTAWAVPLAGEQIALADMDPDNDELTADVVSPEPRDGLMRIGDEVAGFQMPIGGTQQGGETFTVGETVFNGNPFLFQGTVDGRVLAWFMDPTESAMRPSTALFTLDAADPVWEVAASLAPQAYADGLLLGSADGETVVYAPAG
ncbi:MAG TPA: hypothetical protein VFC82_02550 [Actinomycetaceae bacterium]|nr:hypothetical protein [Actinomycetaceae bacterium]